MSLLLQVKSLNITGHGNTDNNVESPCMYVPLRKMHDRILLRHNWHRHHIINWYVSGATPHITQRSFVILFIMLCDEKILKSLSWGKLILYCSILCHITYIHFLFTVSHENCVKILKIHFFNFKFFHITGVSTDMVVIRCFENCCRKLLHFRQCTQFPSVPSFSAHVLYACNMW
jgi:hypothetical protein